ncbi:hypothetical protein HOC35_00405 [Candidatus Woesearchaeota archaeon]|jgi:hypothetical protein|nr:hypothetical protein [Candidatus Woesearchaeota archaeon]
MLFGRGSVRDYVTNTLNDKKNDTVQEEDPVVVQAKEMVGDYAAGKYFKWYADHAKAASNGQVNTDGVVKEAAQSLVDFVEQTSTKYVTQKAVPNLNGLAPKEFVEAEAVKYNQETLDAQFDELFTRFDRIAPDSVTCRVATTQYKH